MKFFHLSDLHIGLRLINRDLREDQLFVFRQIAEYAQKENPDAVVIAGDLYDRAVPSAEAVELFDRFLLMLREAVPGAELMLISGNHDSGTRINLYRGLLKHQHVHLIGLPPSEEGERIAQVTLSDAFGPVHFYLLPFVRPSMVRQLRRAEEEEGALTYDEAVRRLLAREEIRTGERNVLVSHQFYLPSGVDAGQVERTESEIVTVGNIDAVSSDVLAPFDYAALGHIHRPMRAGSEFFRYCGTPLASSVSEAGQQKSVLMVEMQEKGDLRVTELPLKPLREVRKLTGSLEDILARASEDYVSVHLTGEADADGADLQDRIRAAFPNLLEIRRELPGSGLPEQDLPETERADAFELCRAFLPEADDETLELLKSVINAVREGAER